MSPDPLLKISEDIGFIKASQDAVERDIGEIKGTLKEGHETMGELRKDVDAVSITVDDHLNDKSAHPTPTPVRKVRVMNNGGSPGRVQEHKWKIISVTVVTGGAVIMYLIGS